MAVTGGIADWAKGELPQEWDALQSTYGDEFLQRKVNSVMLKLFGSKPSVAVQEALDERVLDYAGKLVALELINPGISYWSKQAISMGARGQNENKAYNDRAQALKELRESLLLQSREMQPEVWPLLPLRRAARIPVGPRVRQVIGTSTSDPDDFERQFIAPVATPAEGGTAL